MSERVQKAFNDMLYDPEDLHFPLAEKWSKELHHSFQCFVNNVYHSGTTDEAGLLIVPDTDLYSKIHQQWRFYESAHDKERAVECARNSLQGWSSMPGHERAKIMHNISKSIKNNLDLLAELETLDSQKPLNNSWLHIIPYLRDAFSYNAAMAELWDLEMKQWLPVGVVAISSYYYSVLPLFSSVCQALAAGNTVVISIQPYHLTPILLAQIFCSARLPPGVFNIVLSRTVTDISGCYVDKVIMYFPYKIGDDEENIILSEIPEANLHVGMLRPTAVVLNGADLDSAVFGILQLLHAWDMAGSRGCRVIVQDSMRAAFLSKFEEQFQALCQHTSIKYCEWSIIFPEQVVEELECHIKKAVKQGGKVIRLHKKEPPCRKNPPILVSNIQTQSSILEKEVVGPVISVLPFRTLTELIGMMNYDDSRGPLSVWTENISVALELATQLKSGMLWVNSQEMEPASCTHFTGNMYLGGKRGLLSFTKPAWTQNSVLKQETVSGVASASENHRPIGCGSMEPTFKIYYCGRLQESSDTTLCPLYCYHGKILGVISEGSEKDSKCAVHSARSASIKWANTDVQKRSSVLLSIAESLEKRKTEYEIYLHESTMASLDNCETEVDMSVQRLRYWAAQAQRSSGDIHQTCFHFEAYEKDVPHGVISVLCPDKKPLLSFVSLFAPAIAKGNTVVMVPSEMYSVPCLKMCEIFEECHVPNGIINVLSGFKTSKLDHLPLYQNVDAVWIHCDIGMDEKFEIPLISRIASWKKWISKERDWTNAEQGQGEEFILYATYTKTVCLSSGSVAFD